MPNVLFLFLRRMRQPLWVLVSAYAISIGGLVLIPGIDENGEAWKFDFFHAFYFISITGPTIGFGELPHEFTGGQRMWVTVCIYITVLSWLYAIGQIFRLLQDPSFSRALGEQRFALQVRRVSEPFYLICGYGGTGSLLVTALTRRGIHCVVLDRQQRNIDDLSLADLSLNVPGFCCDAGEVRYLNEAGIKRENCLGVIAITDDDDCNVRIAVTSKLLRPRLKVIARAQTDETAANLRSFNTDAIINPYVSFADRLGLAIRQPATNLLHAWLGSLPGNKLESSSAPPHGHWILCGYGRFGSAIHHDLMAEGVNCTVIENNPAHAPEGAVIGSGVEAAPLLKAGIEEAAGIVAGTNSDANNLSIILTARELNPDLFLVGRQDKRSNTPVFKAARLDLTIETSRIIVWRILAILTVPMLNEFLQSARKNDNAWAEDLLKRIKMTSAGLTPHTFALNLSEREAPAIHAGLEVGQVITLGNIITHPRDRNEQLPVIPLMLKRKGENLLLPDLETPLETGDRLLCCGAEGTLSRLLWTLNTPQLLDYIRTGKAAPDGWLWRWLATKRLASTTTIDETAS